MLYRYELFCQAWVRAFLAYSKSDLQFPKLHLPRHMPEQIRRIGSLRHVATWLFEKAHISEVKLGWLKSNRRGEVRRQVLKRVLLRGLILAWCDQPEPARRPDGVTDAASAFTASDAVLAAFRAWRDGAGLYERSECLNTQRNSAHRGRLTLRPGHWVEITGGAVVQIVAVFAGVRDAGCFLLVERMLRLECSTFWGDVGDFGAVLTRLGFYLVRDAGTNAPRSSDILDFVPLADVTARVLVMPAYHPGAMRGEHMFGARIGLVNKWQRATP